MLKLRLQSFIFAIVLCLAAPALAQGQGGLSGQLDAAEQKLAQDSQSCAPINLGDYQSLLYEAAKNKRRAEKAKKAGAPVGETQIDADLAKAVDMFSRAVAAHVQQCVRQATGQGQTVVQPQGQAQTTPAPATTPVPAVAESAPGTTGSRIEEAEKKLEADIKACRPINLDDYRAPFNEAMSNADAAKRASKAGATVDFTKMATELRRAAELLEKAKTAYEQQKKTCPPKQEPKAETTPKTGAINLTPLASDLLAAHNQARESVGAPPLAWNPLLEMHATQGAEELARIGQLVHAPREGRGTERENISQGLIGWGSDEMIRSWMNEKARFHPGVFPDVCDGEWSTCAHWSQVIWPTTTEIGCGMATGSGFQWLVCRYNPGGNKDGKPVGVPIQIAGGAGNDAIRPRLIGGDYGGGANVQPVGSQGANPGSPFDLGIYSGGAWSTDWFDDVPIVPSAADSQIVLNHDYGFDSALFVGYDLGAFRIEAETAYKRPGDVYMDELLNNWLSEQQAVRDYVDTQVEQPKLAPTEPFTPSTPSVRDTLIVDLEGPFAELVAETFTLNENKYLDALDQLSAIQFSNYISGLRNNSLSLSSLMSSDDEFWAGSIGVIANLSEVTRLELGAGIDDYDSAGGSFGSGIYWDPVSQVTIGVGATYVETAKSPQCVDEDYKDAIDAVKSYTSANMKGDTVGMDKAKADFAAAVDAQRKLAAGDATEAKILEIMIQTYTDITGEKPPAAGEPEVDTPTDVQQPELPPKEVFNPADRPKCTLEIM